MTGAKSGLDAMCELGGERLTKGATQGVDLGFGGLAGGGPDEPPRVTGARRKGGNARGKGGQGAGRARGRIAQGGELSPGQRIDHRRDEIGLVWKIAVDRAGGDGSAGGDCGHLYGCHSALGGERRSGIEDCLLAGGKPPDDIVGAAIGHRDVMNADSTRHGKAQTSRSSPGKRSTVLWVERGAAVAATSRRINASPQAIFHGWR